MKHAQEISDHKLVKIKMKTNGEYNKKEPDKKVRSKQHAEWASLEMLNKILASNGIEEII